MSSLRGACHICGTTKRDFSSGFSFSFFFFLTFLSSPLLSFPYFSRKKKKIILQAAPALPFPVQTGPGQARESPGQAPGRGQVAREGWEEVGTVISVISGGFPRRRRRRSSSGCPREAVAAARSRTQSAGAAREAGKAPQKSLFLGSNHLLRGLHPRGGWCRIFPLLLAAFLFIFAVGAHL